MCRDAWEKSDLGEVRDRAVVEWVPTRKQDGTSRTHLPVNSSLATHSYMVEYRQQVLLADKHVIPALISLQFGGYWTSCLSTFVVAVSCKIKFSLSV